MGQNEDCSLGSSVSDSSETVPKQQWGESIYKVLVKGEFNAMKYSFYKSFLLFMRI